MRIGIVNRSLFGTLLLSVVGAANAVIVNIDARSNTFANPVTEYFAAGAYNVTPIGTADGGAFDAWNAWGYVNLPYAGWLNVYQFGSADIGYITVGDYIRYSAPLLALENATSASFALPSGGSVYFYIEDRTFDNLGGMSLNVTSAVPIPPTIWLFASGLAGLSLLKKARSSRKSA